MRNAVKKHREQPSGQFIQDRLRALVGPDALPPGSRVPSLRDLASRLQVSHVLVAKHMHQLEKDGLVVPGSQRIRYTANPGANASVPPRRSLPTGTVVVISEVTQVDPTSPFQYQSQTLLTLSRVLQRGGMQTLLLGPPASPDDLERMAMLDADGWIVTEQALIAMPELLPRLSARAREGRPVAIAADILTTAQINDFPGATVCTDHRGGAASLVRALAERGRRRLAVAWTDRAHPDIGMHWMRERAAGIAIGCSTLGLAEAHPLTLMTMPHCPDPRLAFERQTEAWAGSLIRSVLHAAEPVDGVLAVSDGATYPLLAASRLLGRHPGVDLDVTGYDNYWRGVPERQWAGALPCATIDKDGCAVGTSLAEAILAPAKRNSHSVVPGRLVLPMAESVA